METISHNDITINEEAMIAMIAAKVVDARAELAEAKKKAENAEAMFRSLNVDSVTLDDGTKVAIVEQNRRSIDQAEAREALSEGHHQRVSKRVVQQALVDEAVSAGWLKQAIVDKFTKVANVKAVKVTQPKR